MRLKAWKRHVKRLKQNIRILYLASKHPATPLSAKLVVGATVAYALSPIDLIPDFIPILGYIDDLVILPLGIWIAIRLIPEPVWQECRAQTEQEQAVLPNNRRAAIVVIFIWLVVLISLAYWLWKRWG